MLPTATDDDLHTLALLRAKLVLPPGTDREATARIILCDLWSAPVGTTRNMMTGSVTPLRIERPKPLPTPKPEPKPVRITAAGKRVGRPRKTVMETVAEG